jgi:hypothetical protein
MAHEKDIPIYGVSDWLDGQYYHPKNGTHYSANSGIKMARAIMGMAPETIGHRGNLQGIITEIAAKHLLNAFTPRGFWVHISPMDLDRNQQTDLTVHYSAPERIIGGISLKSRSSK